LTAAGGSDDGRSGSCWARWIFWRVRHHIGMAGECRKRGFRSRRAAKLWQGMLAFAKTPRAALR
jgi:hypothetical protein